MANRGIAFESEIKKSADLMGLYYRKLPVPTKLAFGKGQPRLIKLRANGYDGFYIRDGQHVAVELKSSQLIEGFPLSRIETHQREGLSEVLRQGGSAWLLINMRWEMRDGKRRLNNRAWALDWSRWGGLLDALGDSKSIPASLFHSRGWFVPIPRIHVPDPESSKNVLCWDARAFLDG